MQRLGGPVTFVKKTRRGGIVKVVGEVYLRDDVPCGAKRVWGSGSINRGNLKNPALNLREQAAWDVFVAYFPSKNVSITAAYVDLGEIVGALTANRRQGGGYLSLQVGF